MLTASSTPGWPLAATFVPESEHATNARLMATDKPAIAHLQSGLNIMVFLQVNV
jgi:hypothetical protein